MSVTSGHRASTRGLGRLATAAAVAVCLSLAAVLGPGAGAAVTAPGLPADDPLVEGDGSAGGLFFPGTMPVFSDGQTQFSFDLGTLGAFSKLSFADPAGVSADPENIAIVFTGASPSLFALTKLTLIFHGEAINSLAGDAAGGPSGRALESPPDDTNFFDLFDMPIGVGVSVTAPVDNLVRVDVSFTVQGGAPGFDGTLPAFGGRLRGGAVVDPFAWQNLTKAEGGEFDVFIGTNGALDTLEGTVFPLPPPPSVPAAALLPIISRLLLE